MGNREGAREIIQRGIDSVMSKCSSLNYRAGSLLLHEGELEGAIESLKEAVDINPKNVDALELLKLALKLREEQLGDTDGSSSALAVYSQEMSSVENDSQVGVNMFDEVSKSDGLDSKLTTSSSIDTSPTPPANAYSILTSLRLGGSTSVPVKSDEVVSASKTEKRRTSLFFNRSHSSDKSPL